jgi:hypothetical protein
VRRSRAAATARSAWALGLLAATLAACALGLLAAALAACAPRADLETQPARRASEATLKVVNRTSADVRIQVGDRALGEVPAGRDQYFMGVVPGTLDLRGVSVDGALAFRRDLLTLEPGETFTWVLREGESVAQVELPAAPPMEERSATIVVENGTDWEVEVALDGEPLGSVPPSRTVPFDVAPGSHRLEARAEETSFPQEFPVLEPGETFTWRLRPPGSVAGRGLLPPPGTGRLRVENPNAESVTVRVNGVPLGIVEARNTRIFDNLAAAHVRLSAVSGDRHTVYEGPELGIEPGGVALWRLGAGQPLQVSRVGEAGAAVSAPPPVVAPTEPGPPEAQAPPDALPPPGAWPPSDEPLPTASAPAASAPGTAGKAFVVENHTSQDLEIFFDGRSAGAVGAGMTQRFNDLPGLRFTPSAASPSGARRFPHPEVDLSGRESFSWIIEP